MSEKSLIGMRFGRLVVIKQAPYHITPAGNRSQQWTCKCDCGTVKNVSASGLKGGRTHSCGCYNREVASARAKTHSKSKTRLYSIWQRMKSRCNYPHNNRYEYYGAKGITVCDEWNKDFMAFYKWAMDTGYSENLTIDRIDVNGNYEPNNCRWATIKEQANNKSSSLKVTYQGKTLPVIEWAKIKGIKYRTLRYRIYELKWDIEKALTTPTLNRRKQ